MCRTKLVEIRPTYLSRYYNQIEQPRRWPSTIVNELRIFGAYNVDWRVTEYRLSQTMKSIFYFINIVVFSGCHLIANARVDTEFKKKDDHDIGLLSLINSILLKLIQFMLSLFVLRVV